MWRELIRTIKRFLVGQGLSSRELQPMRVPRSHEQAPSRQTPPKNHGRGLSGNQWLLLLVLLSLNTGCAGFMPFHGVPARKYPHALQGERRSGKETINLAKLRRTPPPEYLLDKGDVLAIYVEGVLGDREAIPPVFLPRDSKEANPTLGYPIPVRDDGTISLPLIPALNVRGLSVRQAEDLVKRAYTLDKQILNPGTERILVSLQQPRTYQVLVLRQENQNTTQLSVTSQGSINLGSTKRGTGQIVTLQAYKNDVLHALTLTGGLPGLDAHSAIYVLKSPRMVALSGGPRPLPFPHGIPAPRRNGIPPVGPVPSAMPHPGLFAPQHGPMGWPLQPQVPLFDTPHRAPASGFTPPGIPTSQTKRMNGIQLVGHSIPAGNEDESLVGDQETGDESDLPEIEVPSVPESAVEDLQPPPSPGNRVPVENTRTVPPSLRWRQSPRDPALSYLDPYGNPKPDTTAPKALPPTGLEPLPPAKTPADPANPGENVPRHLPRGGDPWRVNPLPDGPVPAVPGALGTAPGMIPPELVPYMVPGAEIVRIPIRLHPGELVTFQEPDIILEEGDIVFIESRDSEVFYTGGLLGGGQFLLPRDYDLDVF